MKRAIRKTKFLKHGTFKNDSVAKQKIAELQKVYPNRIFSLKKRIYSNKLKFRFTIRSKENG